MCIVVTYIYHRRGWRARSGIGGIAPWHGGIALNGGDA